MKEKRLREREKEEEKKIVLPLSLHFVFLRPRFSNLSITRPILRVRYYALETRSSLITSSNSEAAHAMRANVRRNSICQRGCVVLFHEPDSVSMYIRATGAIKHGRPGTRLGTLVRLSSLPLLATTTTSFRFPLFFPPPPPPPRPCAGPDPLAR